MITHSQYNAPIELRNVRKTFDHKEHPVTPLKDISFVARTGELILLIGPSGSGKTTLLTIIAGLIPESSGSVSLFGTEIEQMNTIEQRDIRRSRIGFVFQAFNLIECLTAVENIALPLQYNKTSKKTS